MITEPAKSIASHCEDKSDDEQTHVASVSKAKGFKIMFLNIYTLLKHLDELRILVDQEMPHVIRINETKIDSSISDTDIQIEGYRVVRRDRNKWGGGVALFIHESISNANLITEPAKSIASHCEDKSDDEQTHVASVSKAKGFKIMFLNIFIHC